MKTREKIIAITERKLREGGYNGFSFRDIADELSVKTASIHYHFPTKEELVKVVATKYDDNFFLNLEKKSQKLSRGQERIRAYINTYQQAYKKAKQPCLCGVLMGEASVLSADIKKILQSVSQRHKAWLETELALVPAAKNKTEIIANNIFAAIEGAMLLASIEQSETPLNQIETHWMNILSE